MQPKFYGAAATYNKPKGFGGLGQILKIVGLFIGVIVLITAGYFGYTALTSGDKNSAAQLVARHKQLLSFMSINQATIADETLSTITSNAISLATSDSYDLTQGLKNYGVTVIPDTIALAEIDTTSAKTLKTASIQSRFDPVFLQLLRNKIAATQQLANQVASSASGTMKTAVQKAIDHLKTTDDRLSKLQL